MDTLESFKETMLYTKNWQYEITQRIYLSIVLNSENTKYRLHLFLKFKLNKKIKDIFQLLLIVSVFPFCIKTDLFIYFVLSVINCTSAKYLQITWRMICTISLLLFKSCGRKGGGSEAASWVVAEMAHIMAHLVQYLSFLAWILSYPNLLVSNIVKLLRQIQKRSY